MVTKTQLVFLSLLALPLFACTPSPGLLPPTPAPVTITLDELFSLTVDQLGTLASADLTVRLRTVMDDWRCPSQVNCAEAGNATVILDAELPGQEPTRFELHVNPPGSQAVNYGLYQLQLVTLDPYPENIDQTIPLSDYQATLLVSALPPTATAQPNATPTSASTTPVASDEGPPLEAETAYQIGLTSLMAGDTDHAVTSLTEAITLYPTYMEAYQQRGDAYRQLGRYDLARADYEQVLALNPEPEVQATVTAALQEIAQAVPVLPTTTVTPTSGPATPPPSPPIAIALDEPFVLKINQQGDLAADDLHIELLALLEDSRCPRQVECFWSGQARITIRVWLGSVEPTAFELNNLPSSDRNVVTYEAYQIQFLSLEPYPETTDQTIQPEDYQATLVVTKN